MDIGTTLRSPGGVFTAYSGTCPVLPSGWQELGETFQGVRYYQNPSGRAPPLITLLPPALAVNETVFAMTLSLTHQEPPVLNESI